MNVEIEKLELFGVSECGFITTIVGDVDLDLVILATANAIE